MDKSTFWKNFNLGIELDVAGTFIYNGLMAFNEMESFYYEVDSFEFLYNIAVGIERLEKICIILIEHDNIEDQKEFEKGLITHNHLELYKRIENKYSSNFGAVHNAFLNLLSKFYKSWRYDRYILEEAYKYSKEKDALIQFINQFYNENIKVSFPFEITSNSNKIRKFMGRTVGKISEYLYEIIWQETYRLNIFTYEIRLDSKAGKIFLRKEFDFFKESIVWKEILIFLMHGDKNKKAIEIFDSLSPLSLDVEMIGEYLKSINSPLNRQKIIDEIYTEYKYINNIKERVNQLELLDEYDNILYFDDESPY